MSVWIIMQDVNGGMGPLYTLTVGTDIVFAVGVNVSTTSGNVVFSDEGNVGVFVSAGAHIHGGYGAFSLGADNSSDNWIEVDEGALVSGGYWGAALDGNGFVLTNRGQVVGNMASGVLCGPTEATYSGYVMNTGQIIGGINGLNSENGSPKGVLTVVNSGLIWGGTYALNGAGDVTYRITNRGELRGIVELGNKNDVIDNIGGKITGDLRLQGGNDGYNGTTGHVTGAVFAGSGNDKLYGGKSAEMLYGEAGIDILEGNGGNDMLSGGADNDKLYGGADNDNLYGNSGNDYLQGDAGNDILYGGDGADMMTGGSGNDTYVVDNADDIVTEAAGGGSDFVQSSISWRMAANVEKVSLTGAANINAIGNTLGNTMTGNTGNNALDGSAGNDTISAGNGNDRLYGGSGNDKLIGGGGSDVFVFHTALSSSANLDTIVDFNVADDTIWLDNAVFKGLGSATGALNSSMFWKNTTGLAHDTSDHVIYESDTGKLFYDSNGSASGGSVQIAQLSANLVLTASDFLVI